jgi:aryl-alcohol dehydrogenase-like predicted oxidoreductase
VSSKWGYTYTAGWRVDAEVHEVKDHSVDQLRGQIIQTRKRLGEWLDLYQIHSATVETGVLTDQAVLAELAALSEEGLAVGLSVSGPGQPAAVRQALDASVDGLNPFRAVQATWNILEPSAGPALAEAADEGWTVLVKEGVANGRLAPGSGTALPWAVRVLLARIAARNGLSRDALALAAVLAQPWADVVLSGAATVDHLRSNLQALDAQLGENDLAELATLAEPPEQYWATRSALPWT